MSSLLSRFPALLKLAARGRRIPVVQQLSATECGAACLTMILAHHGKAVRLDEVREVSGVDRDGTNAASLLAAGRHYNLRGRGVRIDIDDLQYLQTASILHWEFNHFVVFERLRPDGVDIVDPAFGRRRVPIEQFRKSFTGIALLFEPNERFELEAAPSNRVWRHVRRVLGESSSFSRVVLTSLMIQVFALAVPVLTGALVERVLPRADRHLMLVLGVGLFSLVIFNFIASMVRAHLLLHLRTHLDTRMTLGFLDHLIDLPYAFFQRRSAGDLMMRLNSNTTIREILTSGVLSGLLDGALVTFYFVILAVASSEMALLVALLGFLQVATFLVTRSRQRDLMAQNLQAQAKAESYQVEMLAGMETLKVLGAETRAVGQWSNLFVSQLNVALERGRISAFVDSAMSTLRLAAPVLLLMFGAVQVLDGRMTLGAMLGLNALALAFLTPLASLVASASQLQLLASYVERIDDVMHAPPEQDALRARPAPPLRGHLKLERVSFRYGVNAPLVLDDISVEIQPGAFVAIVGRSGSGKSTLANLLLGLHLPTSGRICFDGNDLTELELRSLRRQLGMVPQRPYLFGSTIRANIALADPRLTLDEVQQAGRLAQIHDEIMAMPMGYETLLVDGGLSISGGQRQRIALARALAQRPAVLLLDEATSALDSISERRVQQALAGLGCTRVVIAHRLSTVVDANLILVMDQGKLAEWGSHGELLRRGGIYAQLVAAQLQDNAEVSVIAPPPRRSSSQR